MGTKGIQLLENLGVDVNDLIESLTKLLQMNGLHITSTG